MKEKYLITVIVPVYNAVKTIEKCIKSIQEQSYNNLEIILINDGSEDKSGIICDKYAYLDQRIKVINKKNEGVARARNSGLAIASGKYVCFVDADDYIDRNYVYELIKNKIEVDSNLVICGYKDIYIKKDKYNIKDNSIYEGIININDNINEEIFVNGLIHPCWGKLYDLEIIKNNHLKFKDLKLSEDTVFNLEYINYCNTISLINKSLYNYIHNNDAISITNKVYEDIFDNYTVVHSYFDNLKNKCCSEKINDIVSRTMYPQYYSAFIKILCASDMKLIKKRTILNSALDNKLIYQTFKLRQKNKTINIINYLICSRMYGMLTLVFKVIRLKNRLVESKS